MEILTPEFGFCIGINRAYRGMNERAVQDGAFTVAHQNSMSEFDTLRRIDRRDPELLKRYPGLERVSVAYDVAALAEDDRLVLGFHGLPAKTKEDLATRGVNLLDDLICPFIAKLDRVVERHVEEGFDVAIVGTKENHHCRVAKQICEEHGHRCYVIERADDIESLPYEDGRRIALVGQVTGNTETFKEVIERLQKSQKPVKIVKTMCSDSYNRQRVAAEFAREADLIIMVDDGGDGSKSVLEVCSRVNPRIHRIRSKDDLRAEWFDGVQKTAVLGGILVPDWLIDEVSRHIRALCSDREKESPVAIA
jgi:4-hydroxy-3-methylbut-2-enyl diphosphate reductase